MLVLGITSGPSREVRATSGADGKRRRVSLSTECTVAYTHQSVTQSKSTINEGIKRTVVHLFEAFVGGGACWAKSLKDFSPQTTTYIGIKRK